MLPIICPGCGCTECCSYVKARTGDVLCCICKLSVGSLQCENYICSGCTIALETATDCVEFSAPEVGC